MGSELKSIQRWYFYNRVARQRYFDTLAKLPPAELNRERGASFPTLLDIVGHSLGGIATWIVRMSAVNGERFKLDGIPEPQNLDDLRALGKVLDGYVDEFFARLKEEDLDRTFLVPKHPPWWDEDFTTSFRNTLLHVIEHELQHRGELNALLWQIDVDPPILNWDEFEKIEAGHRSPS